MTARVLLALRDEMREMTPPRTAPPESPPRVAPGAMTAEGVGTVDLDTIVNLDDLERAAERVMDKQDFDYFAGGALPSPATAAFSETARARPAVPSRRPSPRDRLRPP